jgi:hypothetical protein
VNLKIDVQRVGLNLCKSGLGAAYRARVWGLERQRRTLKTRVLSLKMHVPTLRLTLVRCGRFSTEMILRKSNDKIWILFEILYKIAHSLQSLQSSRTNCSLVPTIHSL